MSLVSNTFANIASIEFGKFVGLSADARFPAMSAVRQYHRDNGAALTAVDVYQKYAILTYNVNEGQNNSAGWDTAQCVFSSAYVAFPSNNASSMTIFNSTSTVISVKRSGSSSFGIPLSSGATLSIPISGNTNEVSLIRTDAAAVPVSAYCMYTF